MDQRASELWRLIFFTVTCDMALTWAYTIHIHHIHICLCFDGNLGSVVCCMRVVFAFTVGPSAVYLGGRGKKPETLPGPYLSEYVAKLHTF